MGNVKGRNVVHPCFADVPMSLSRVPCCFYARGNLIRAELTLQCAQISSDVYRRPVLPPAARDAESLFFVGLRLRL